MRAEALSGRTQISQRKCQARLVEEEHLWSVIVLGTFEPRMYAVYSTAEALQTLALIGMADSAIEVRPGPAVVEVIRVSLRSSQEVTTAVNRLRARPVASDLTGSGQIRANRARRHQFRAR